MKKKEYWDITRRPHTKRKLVILEKYIKEWATIIFSQWRKKGYKNFKTAYYIDCFAGRGKYHQDGKENSVNGSPLIGLECARHFNKKFGGEIELKCILVEKRKEYIEDLRKFCHPYKKTVKYQIYHADINEAIEKILEIVQSKATLFFVDPWSLKELEQKTVKQIVSKNGPNDLLLNYICGTKRVLGRVKNMVTQDKVDQQFIKLVDSVRTFHGLDFILKCFDKKDRDILIGWAKEIIKDTKLKQTSVYKMLRPSKNEAAYYLFFASRSPIAKKVIDYIFKKEESITYTGQISLLPKDSFDF